MDEGSDLNIMYTKTLDIMGVDRTHLHLIRVPFHGVVLEKVITIGTSFHHAYECKVKCCGHATAIVAFGELAALKEEVTEGAPDAKKSTGSFEMSKGSKEVLIDANSSEGKMVRIGTTLSSK
ncbi:uncharacterized protein [Miscanthus floridulus]|uniref:uncharacterized protein n=1 Tax=Miscanthus floridulus TaxID=154761 RepID=UPI0034580224